MTVIDAAGAIRANSAPGVYPVNLRLSVPFLPRPFFVTLIIGRERRGPQRLREERTRHPVNTWGNLFTMVSFWGVVNVAVLFAALVATRL